MNSALRFRPHRNGLDHEAIAPDSQKALFARRKSCLNCGIGSGAASSVSARNRIAALAAAGVGLALLLDASLVPHVRADAADLGQVPSERARVRAGVSDSKEILTLNEAAASIGQIEAAEACLAAQKATQASKLRQLKSAKAQLKARAGTPKEAGARLIVQTLLADMGEVQRTALKCGQHLRNPPSARAQGRIVNQLKEERSVEGTLRPAGFSQRDPAADEVKPAQEAAPLALNVRLLSTSRSGGRGAMGITMARKAIASTAAALAQCYDGYVERKRVEPIALEVELRFAQRSAARRLRLRTLRPGDVELHACTNDALTNALSAYAPASGWSAFVYRVHLGPYDAYAQPQAKSITR